MTHGCGGLDVGAVLDEALDASPVTSEGGQVERGTVMLRTVVNFGLKLEAKFLMRHFRPLLGSVTSYWSKM